MRKMISIAAVLLTILAVTHAADTEEEMGNDQEEARILEILDTYVKAFRDADADLMESLVWLNDERFTEIEDMIPMPFGKETFEAISEWIRANAEPGTREMTFHEPKVFFLSDNVAYLITIQEIKTPDSHGQSRVTLILLKKEGTWKIIHGHFSDVPVEE